MRENNISIINSEEYVVLEGRPEGYLYLDSEALHNFCGQSTKFSNNGEYSYTDLRFVNNSNKWKPGSLYFEQWNNDQLSRTEDIIETEKGLMLKVKMQRIGSFLIDSTLFKYYTGGLFVMLYGGGTLEAIFHFTSDPYDLEFRDINKEYEERDTDIDDEDIEKLLQKI